MVLNSPLHQKEPYYNVVEVKGKKAFALNLNHHSYRISEEAVRANSDEPMWGAEWHMARGIFLTSLIHMQKDFDESGDEVVNWGIDHPKVDQALRALEDEQFSGGQNEEAIQDAVILSVLCLANAEMDSSNTIQFELGLKLAAQLKRDDVKTHSAAKALKPFATSFIETVKRNALSEITTRANAATKNLA